QVVLLDVLPDLLGHLGARQRGAADDRRERFGRLQRLHELLVGLSFGHRDLLCFLGLARSVTAAPQGLGRARIRSCTYPARAPPRGDSLEHSPGNREIDRIRGESGAILRLQELCSGAGGSDETRPLALGGLLCVWYSGVRFRAPFPAEI